MIYKNKKSNNVFLIYLAMFLVFLSTVLVLFMSNDSFVEDTWQNYAEYDFEQEVVVDENGEEVVFNVISSPEQLAGAFNLMNSASADDWKTGTESAGTNQYKLSKNINLYGKTWKISDLTGVFDGCSFSILNLTISANANTNIVGFVGNNHGTIKNLYFDNISVTTAKTSGVYVGGVVGINYGTVQKVSVMSGKVYGKSGKYTSRLVGGLVGTNRGRIEFCTNNASVYNGSHIGGICGTNDYVVVNCHNSGNITAYQNEATRLGGIIGESSSSATIQLCLNSGNITNSSTSDTTAVGGIVGYCYAKIDQCGNYGTINGGDSSTPESFVGGIVGYMKADVLNCFNRGNVTASAKEDTDKDNADAPTGDAVDSDYILISDHMHGFAGWEHDRVWYTREAPKVASYKSMSAYAGGIAGYSN